jgi:hypothetical protein
MLLFSLRFLKEKFLIVRGIQQDVINVLRSSCEVPVIVKYPLL